jgi:hypothetical protein
MQLIQGGLPLVAPAIQARLNQVQVDGASGRLCMVTERGLEPVSTEREAFRRLYQANLEISAPEDKQDESAAAEAHLPESQQWRRGVGIAKRTFSIVTDFWHSSGRYLKLNVPLPLDTRPGYQIMRFGVEKHDVGAYVENHVRSGAAGFPQLNVRMGFCFSKSAIPVLASDALKLSAFTSMHQIAINMTSEFYISRGYFFPGPESRLRILLNYEQQEDAESISLEPDREGLVAERPIKTEGLRKFHVCSISEENCYFNIYGDIAKHSLSVYCHLSGPLGEASLHQRPMPALLWDIVREQTGVSLEEGIA